MKIAIVGDADAARLAGLDGEFQWGRARTGDQATDGFEGDVAVALGPAPFPEGPEAPRLRLLHVGGGNGPGERLLAPSGTGLWRRAPWPVRDDVFELPPPPREAPVLVVGAAEPRAAMLAQLEGRFLAAVERDRITVADLTAASVVVVAGRPGDPLPAEAMAVLAAGRVLVTPTPQVSFGLLPQVDHFAYDDIDEAGSYADIGSIFPDALESIRAMGRIATRAHRASNVYQRLAFDLLQETG
jgi:hypothetical protein